MPEGPSLVILKEEANRFLGKTVASVEGNTTIVKERVLGRRIESLRNWGKHFLIEFDDFSLKSVTGEHPCPAGGRATALARRSMDPGSSP